MKLYPPIIDGIIPAFNGTVLTVPFSMNRAVGRGDYTGFVAKIRTINGFLVGVLTAAASSVNEISFNIPDSMYKNFNIGQFYKVQIAYKNGETVGYYSTVGIVKFTSPAVVEIGNLSASEINNHQYSYVCSYRNEDTTEKMNSVEFILYKNKEVILTSGEIMHNSTEDDLPNIQSQSYDFDYIFEESANYSIRAIVTTVNKMVVSSPYYRLYDANNIESEIASAIFTAELDYDHGCIRLKIQQPNTKKLIQGAFLISRKGSNNGIWEEFKRFELEGKSAEDINLIDDTVVHGITYEYSIQQYNSYGVYSKRKKIDTPITAYFEDMFLVDAAGRKLKIKFNPKVSTFKKDLLESKIDTIGSKYPYILKNGNVDYKEFSLSGLISYQMDDIYTFFNTDEGTPHRHLTAVNDTDFVKYWEEREALGARIPTAIKNELEFRKKMKHFFSTDLTDENIAREKEFKLEVLDWLTNGEPKLLKTPTEGNYIVRLMNVNLSPNDTLGRMLHTFTCQAYEIADYNKQSLVYYNFITIGETNEKTLIANINLYEKSKEIKENNIKTDFVILNKFNAQYIEISDMIPGTRFLIDGKEFIINSTGRLSMSGDFSEIAIDRFYLENISLLGGQVLYAYKTKDVQGFGDILKQSLKDTMGRNMFDFYAGKKLESLNDIKQEIVKVYYIKCERKEIVDIYVKYLPNQEEEDEGWKIADASKYSYYYDYNCKNPIDFKEIKNLSEVTLFRLRYGLNDAQDTSGEYLNAVTKHIEDFSSPREFNFVTETRNGVLGQFYYTNNSWRFSSFDKLYEFTIDGEKNQEVEKISNLGIKNVFIPNPNISLLSTLSFGIGIIPSIGYCSQLKVYNVEESSQRVKELKKRYEERLKIFLEAPDVPDNKKDVQQSYLAYITGVKEEKEKERV